MVNGYYDSYAVRAGGKLEMFRLDDCEACGKRVKGANSVWLVEPERKAKMLGLVRRDDVVEELGFDEPTGLCVCDSCASPE